MTSKITFYVLSVVALILFANVEVFACSCVPPIYGEPLSEQVRKEKTASDAIFTGKVLSIVEDRDDEYILVDLEVVDLWKGKLTEKVTVLTGLHDGNCRFDFKVNETYLVYASHLTMYSSVRSLSTGMCDRTAILSKAKADIRFLGRRRKPQKS